MLMARLLGSASVFCFCFRVYSILAWLKPFAQVSLYTHADEDAGAVLQRAVGSEFERVSKMKVRPAEDGQSSGDGQSGMEDALKKLMKGMTGRHAARLMARLSDQHRRKDGTTVAVSADLKPDFSVRLRESKRAIA